MELPINFAYEGSITPGDVTFWAVWPDEVKTPLRYSSRVVLGLKEGAAAAYTSAGAIKEGVTAEALAQGNPHQVDYCCIPYNSQGVCCETSITITSDLFKPEKCSDISVKKTVNNLIMLYGSKIKWDELAERYLINICNGSWLWKNIKTAYYVNIELTAWPGFNKVIFDDVVQGQFDKEYFRQHESWPLLVQLVIDVLSQPHRKVIFEIAAFVKLPKNSPIRPSQEFTEQPKGSKKTDHRHNSRVYQHTLIEGDKSPIIGCYKHGAAIAKIDDWYPDAEETIRVGHYGVDKENVTCHRHPSTGKDFFSLLKRADEFVKLLESDAVLSEEIVNDLHYVMANIIKGGMFQRVGGN